MLASARRLSHKRLFSFKPRGAVKTSPYKAGVNGRLYGPHMRGPQLSGKRSFAGRPRAGRLSAHNERRQFASKHARAVVCPAGANIVRVPVSFHSTVVLRSQPRNARPLQLSWAVPAHPPASRSPSAPGAPSLQWRCRAQSSPPLPSLQNRRSRRSARAARIPNFRRAAIPAR